MVALLVFIIATLKSNFWPKKTVGLKGPFRDNVLKNPARCKYVCICECMHVRMYKETDGTGLTLEHMYVCQQGPQSQCIGKSAVSL